MGTIDETSFLIKQCNVTLKEQDETKFNEQYCKKESEQINKVLDKNLSGLLPLPGIEYLLNTYNQVVFSLPTDYESFNEEVLRIELVARINILLTKMEIDNTKNPYHLTKACANTSEKLSDKQMKTMSFQYMDEDDWKHEIKELIDTGRTAIKDYDLKILSDVGSALLILDAIPHKKEA